MATFLPQGSTYNRAPAPSTPKVPKPPKSPKPTKVPKAPKASRSSLSLRSMRSGLTAVTSRSSDDKQASRASIQTTSSSSSGSTMKTRKFDWDVTPRASSQTARVVLEYPATTASSQPISRTPALPPSPILNKRPPYPQQQLPQRPHPLSIPTHPLPHPHARLPIAPNRNAPLPRHPKLDHEDRRVHNWISEQCTLAVEDLGCPEETVLAATPVARRPRRAATISTTATAGGWGNERVDRRVDVHALDVPPRPQVQVQHPRLRVDTDMRSAERGRGNAAQDLRSTQGTGTRRMGHVRAPPGRQTDEHWYWSPSSASPSHLHLSGGREEQEGEEDGRLGSALSGSAYGLPPPPPPPPSSTQSSPFLTHPSPSSPFAHPAFLPSSSAQASTRSPPSSAHTSPHVAPFTPTYTNSPTSAQRHQTRARDQREDEDDWDARCDSPLLGFGSDCSYSSFPLPPPSLPPRLPLPPLPRPPRTSEAVSPGSRSKSRGRIRSRGMGRRGSESTEEDWEGEGEDGDGYDFPRTPGVEEYGYGFAFEGASPPHERDPLRYPGKGYVRELPSGLEDDGSLNVRSFGRRPGGLAVSTPGEKGQRTVHSVRRFHAPASSPTSIATATQHKTVTATKSNRHPPLPALPPPRSALPNSSPSSVSAGYSVYNSSPF